MGGWVGRVVGGTYLSREGLESYLPRALDEEEEERGTGLSSSSSFSSGWTIAEREKAGEDEGEGLYGWVGG